MANIFGKIAQELGVREQQVEATVTLLDGGATVPFIARYRKEVTGGLEQRTGRVDPGRSDPGGLQHSAETALAAANIQRTREPAVPDTAEHHGIEHMFARPISALTDGVDPGLR